MYKYYTLVIVGYDVSNKAFIISAHTGVGIL